MSARPAGPAFDAYVMVDWSGASTPKNGRDSIWYAATLRRGGGLDRVALANPATRAEAEVQLLERLDGLSRDRRILVGFDFPFGYSRGTATALGVEGAPWHATWTALAAAIEDGQDNANNRFDVAEDWNRRIAGEAFPFWGNTRDEARRYLTRRRFRHHGPRDIPERRFCELRVRRTQPVWKLAYAGSVGSQVLLGLPRVWALRQALGGRAAIWPFETGLGDAPDKAVIFAEIYPSLVTPADLPGLPKDAGQVVAVTERYAALDACGRLSTLFGADPGLMDDERRIVVEEEAWILGVTDGPRVG